MKTFLIAATLIVGALTAIDRGNKDTPAQQSLTLAANFDKCKDIAKAEYMGSCVADWAIAISKSIQINYCLKEEKLRDLYISFQDLMCSCKKCLAKSTFPCAGGSVELGLQHVEKEGVVGGSSYEKKTPQIGQPLIGGEEKF